MSSETTTRNHPDTSKEAIARRMRLREFSLQNQALRLRDGGMSNKQVGVEMRIPTPEARTLADVASSRRMALAGAKPHPDPDSLELTDPERILLLSVLEVRLGNWGRRDCSNPDTGIVGRRVRKSSGWAVSCANRRLRQRHDHQDERSHDLVECSGNGYIGLTRRGWDVVLALWPDVFEGIDIPDASHRPAWMR